MNEVKIYATEHSEFITTTCLKWKLLLKDDKHKDIITSSLDFLSKERRALIYAFVIMDNPFHFDLANLG